MASLTSLEVVEQLITDTANIAITSTGVASSGIWLTKHSCGNVLKRTRDSLHHTMNILDALAKDGIPVPDALLHYLRGAHEALTARADRIEKNGGTIRFFSKDGLVKSFQLNVKAHEIESNAENLRYKAQRASDLVRSMHMGSGSLIMHRTSSRLSLISNSSWVMADLSSTTQPEIEGAEGGIITSTPETSISTIVPKASELPEENYPIIGMVLEPNPWADNALTHN